MNKFFEILWFNIIYYRVLWHNRKYDDFMGADLSCGKNMAGISIYIKDNGSEENFNIFGINKFFIKKYYDGFIRKGTESTNITINCYVESTFSNRKLVVKHLKSYNLI